MSKNKVLIVDDNPENLNILYRLLEKYYDVLATEKGELVQEMVNSHNPDIIILDIMMPFMNGYEVCQNLKSVSKTKDIPVIFMSALSETIDIVKGFEVGGVDYITKPYQREVVLHRLATHLDLSKSKEKIKDFNNVLIKKVNEKTKILEEKIDEITRMNHILRESDDKYRKLFSAAPEGILIVNVATMEVIDANSSALELFNCKLEEIIGQTNDKLFCKESKRIDEIVTNISNKDSSKKIFHNKIVRKSGEELDVELTSRVILIEGEMCQQVVIRDITKQIKYEDGLKEAKLKADELNKLKSAFLANMAHELRTPLIGILGYSQILNEELTDESHLIMTNGINSTGQRLLKTLNLLMDLSMLGEKNHTFNMVPINIINTLDEACLKYLPKAKSKGLKIIKNHCRTEIIVSADERMIYSVFCNLLSNAVKFTEKGELSISTEIQDKTEGEFVAIYIKDTGIGISKDKIDTIFEEFRQESEGVSRDYQGLGLGLTLSKKFIDFNEGEIQLESKKDVGTEVRVLFKICKN